MGKILVVCKGFVTDLKVLVLVKVLLVVRIFLITVISDFKRSNVSFHLLLSKNHK